MWCRRERGRRNSDAVTVIPAGPDVGFQWEYCSRKFRGRPLAGKIGGLRGMNVVDFVNSIYLGDRGCMKIVLDGINREVCIQVDCISRVRSPDGRWNFYSDEDIENGYIIITDVYRTIWNDSERIPNDYIGYLEVEKQDGERYIFSFSSDSVDADGSNYEVVLKIVAGGIYLADPAKPGVQIRD